MKKLAFPEPGDQVQHNDVVLEVEAVDTCAYILYGGTGLIPVRFTDDTLGLVCIEEINDGQEDGEMPKFYAWVPDLPEAAEVLRHARSADVGHSIGSDVLNVQVTAKDGRRALIKLFKNAKKLEHHRQDELHWLSETASQTA